MISFFGIGDNDNRFLFSFSTVISVWKIAIKISDCNPYFTLLLIFTPDFCKSYRTTFVLIYTSHYNTSYDFGQLTIDMKIDLCYNKAGLHHHSEERRRSDHGKSISRLYCRMW